LRANDAPFVSLPPIFTLRRAATSSGITPSTLATLSRLTLPGSSVRATT
jgi:hypothetical protein